MIAATFCRGAQAQTVATDQADYAPGSVVQITGSGFHASETVTLQVVHTDGTDDLSDPDHQPWSVRTDDSGSFTAAWDVDAADVAGSSFKLTADCMHPVDPTDPTPHLHAETTFTDASQPVTAAMSGSGSTCPSSAVTITGTAAHGTKPYFYRWTQTAANGSVVKQTRDPATGTTQSGTSTFSPDTSIVGAFTISVAVTDSSSPNATASASQTLTVNPRPTAVVSGSTVICSGGSTQIQATLSGAGPWNVTWSDGTIQSSVVASPAVRVVSPTTTTTYAVTALSDAHCTANQGDLSGSATVAVNTKAVITSCPGNITVPNDSGKCSAVVSFAAAASGVPTPVITYSQNPGTAFPVGTTTVVVTATNGCSTVTCSFTVTVADTEKPAISCPGTLPSAAAGSNCQAPVPDVTGLVTASDNCGRLSLTQDPPAGTLVGLGPHPITVTATDGAGLTNNCTTTFTVVAPALTISCPASQTVPADAGICSASGISLGTPTTSGGCGMVTVSSNAPSTFPLGSTTVTWTATDGSGQSAICTQTVTVVDNQPPSIMAPGAVSVNTDAGHCTASHVSLGTPVTSDNCGVKSVTNDAPAEFPVGTTTVTWTVTDVNGNSSTSTQLVTVTDNEAPAITAPAALTVSADPGQCAASAVNLGTPTTSDNCGVASVKNDAPAQFPVGTTTVTWTVTDIHGNTAASSQTVTVKDTEKPGLICPAAVVVSNDPGQCQATLKTAPLATAMDNCPGVTVSGSRPDGKALTDPYPMGSTTITWTATDAAGNSASGTQTVTVQDTEAPQVTCPTTGTTAIATCVGASTGAIVTYPAPVVTDNCGGVSVTCSPPPGSLFPCGMTPVTCTATDGAGNRSQSTFYVTVACSWSGLLQPMNPDGSSVFKLGSTIPVKFQLTGPSACITNASARLYVVQMSNSVIAQVNEASSTAAADAGNNFRYDPTSQQYIFNLGTKSLAKGIYYLKVDLGDGVIQPLCQFGLR